MEARTGAGGDEEHDDRRTKGVDDHPRKEERSRPGLVPPAGRAENSDNGDKGTRKGERGDTEGQEVHADDDPETAPTAAPPECRGCKDRRGDCGGGPGTRPPAVDRAAPTMAARRIRGRRTEKTMV